VCSDKDKRVRKCNKKGAAVNKNFEINYYLEVNAKLGATSLRNYTMHVSEIAMRYDSKSLPLAGFSKSRLYLPLAMMDATGTAKKGRMPGGDGVLRPAELHCRVT
jgi:hypothetical protein